MRSDRAQLVSSPPFPLGQHVNGRLLEQPDGRIELAVIIDEQTMAEDVGQAAPAIDRIRMLLRRLQGSTSDEPHNALLDRYAELHAHGWSTSVLAMDVNYACLVQLCHAADEIPHLDQPWPTSEGVLHALLLLNSMGIADTGMMDTLLPAITAIHDGHAPWPLDAGPVTWFKVWQALRRLNQPPMAAAVGGPTARSRRSIYAATLAAIEHPQRRYCEHAQRLLRQDYPESLDNYTERVWQLLQRLDHEAVDGD